MLQKMEEYVRFKQALFKLKNQDIFQNIDHKGMRGLMLKNVEARENI